jgi:hypothetical protein
MSSRWNRSIQEIEVDHTDHAAYVQLDPGGACDVGGFIDAVRQLDPEVEQILVGERDAPPDMRYEIRGSTWTARRLVWKEPATADIA